MIRTSSVNLAPRANSGAGIEYPGQVVAAPQRVQAGRAQAGRGGGRAGVDRDREREHLAAAHERRRAGDELRRDQVRRPALVVLAPAAPVARLGRVRADDLAARVDLVVRRRPAHRAYPTPDVAAATAPQLLPPSERLPRGRLASAGGGGRGPAGLRVPPRACPDVRGSPARLDLPRLRLHRSGDRQQRHGPAPRPADRARRRGGIHLAHRAGRHHVDDLQPPVRPGGAPGDARPRESRARRLEHRHLRRRHRGAELRARADARARRPLPPRRRVRRGLQEALGQLGARCGAPRQGARRLGRHEQGARRRPPGRALLRRGPGQAAAPAPALPAARAGGLVACRDATSPRATPTRCSRSRRRWRRDESSTPR